jgi:hypothetical protein
MALMDVAASSEAATTMLYPYGVNPRASFRLPAVALVATLAAPAGALGAGGTTIASAPTIAPGATITANSATDQTAVGDDGVGFESGCWDAVEYWKMPLTAGDAVTVSVTIDVPSYNLEIGVFPAGTTDKTLANAHSVKTGLPTDKVPLTFTAPATGTYALAAGPNCYTTARVGRSASSSRSRTMLSRRPPSRCRR